MQSGFAASFHESLGGIRPNDDYPGFKRFSLKPTFLEGVNWVEVTHKSPQGTIESSWKKEGSKIIWSIKVPDNSEANIQLPYYQKEQITLNNTSVNANVFSVSSGTYTIIVTNSK